MFDSLLHEIELIERAHRILFLVEENGPIGIRRLSRFVGKEHHEIPGSLQLLESRGYVEPTPDGAVTTTETWTYLTEVDDDIDSVIHGLDSFPTLDAIRAER